MHRNGWMIALAAGVLAACQTVTPYGPASRAEGPGYSQFRIEQDRYRINFRGYPGGDPARMQNFALLRAAELTLEQGGDYFIVDARDNYYTGRGGGSSSLSFGVGGASFGRHSAVGVGTGVGIPLGDTSAEQVAMIEIRIGKGPKPEAPNAYDARQVQQSIGYGERPRPSGAPPPV